MTFRTIILERNLDRVQLKRVRNTRADQSQRQAI